VLILICTITPSFFKQFFSISPLEPGNLPFFADDSFRTGGGKYDQQNPDNDVADKGSPGLAPLAAPPARPGLGAPH
jgi:hypothetical protein